MPSISKLFYIVLLMFSVTIELKAQQNAIIEYTYSFHPEKINNRIKGLKDAPKMEVTNFMKMTEAYAKQHRYILKFTPKDAYFKVEAGAKPYDLFAPGCLANITMEFWSRCFLPKCSQNDISLIKKQLEEKNIWLRIQLKTIGQFNMKRKSGGYKCYKAIKKTNRPKGFTTIALFTPIITVPIGTSHFA